MTGCSECQGTGYVLSVETVFCRACDSTGKLLGSICTYCDGAGQQVVEIKVQCFLCYPERADEMQSLNSPHENSWRSNRGPGH